MNASRDRKKGWYSGLACVRLETLDEGKCVQTLHIGSYDDEADTLAKMHHEFIPANHFKMVKKHHEIYFFPLRPTNRNQVRRCQWGSSVRLL